MNSELGLHRLVIGIIAVLLAVFVTIVLPLDPSLGHRYLEVTVSLAIVLAIVVAPVAAFVNAWNGMFNNSRT